MFQIEKNGIKECCLELERMYGQLKSLRQRMEELKTQIKLSDAAMYRKIQKMTEELMEEEALLYKFYIALERILAVYEESECRVTAVLEEERYPVLIEKLAFHQFQWLETTGIRFK